MSDEAMIERGKQTRAQMMGPEYEARVRNSETPFSQPIRDFTTQYVWGEIWSDPTIPHRTRSLINIAMLTVMHCSEELKTHVRGARRNGCSWDEIRAVLKHAGVYSGAPALRSATRFVNEVYLEETAPRPATSAG
ncbi:MAG: carboxymuconolactone decarboxylase family protein [Burkholderiales bacterium]|nr:carboxymuconolactone decarboxylase family protein [Burkholderiales bacterium]